jgi:hypothetical protein
MDMSKDLVAASATPLVLAILAEGDSYGYAIIKRVAELSGGHLQWTDGMLYPVLHRLERQGLVAAKWSASETGRRRKYYRITKEGRLVVLGLTVAAALAIKVPALFGLQIDGGDQPFYFRNAGLFVLPLLTVYFIWKRSPGVAGALWLALPFAAGAVFANTFPFSANSDTERLTALHLPITLWLVVGFAYVRNRWFADGGRMDFVRFSGELAIYYVLIALGGFVLIGFTVMSFASIGMKADWLIGGWLVPCGAAGAVIIGSWLVEAKQSVIENMAPVLTRLLTPLFTVLLLAFLGTMAWTGSPINVERQVLIGFDLLLALVVGLVLYAASARDSQAPPDFFDGLQFLLVVSALVVDGVALAAIAARISDFGFTPNRVAALGENLILLVNLARTAWLYARFVRHRGSLATLERWQVAYLPVGALWAAIVVIVFPPVFGYR